ncbi:hypothetical protein AVEN_219103-1 [Araneus ventricosus]|uniref:Uncharacterized protein n=1 Tax=Araneus ventricosus TaxID=182803 RepID=A0A4Y2RQF2_ARAVE|nr:hypothetical protein AVEN_219103-1 [Araneus ventricosus]
MQPTTRGDKTISRVPRNTDSAVFGIEQCNNRVEKNGETKLPIIHQRGQRTALNSLPGTPPHGPPKTHPIAPPIPAARPFFKEFLMVTRKFSSSQTLRTKVKISVTLSAIFHT